ncbi:MAG: family 10 glycosylhydrolase [Pseudomonadota bacterium]
MKLHARNRQKFSTVLFFLQLFFVFSSTAAFAVQPLVFKPFDNPSFQTVDATNAWSPQGMSSPVTALSDAGGNVMVLPCNRPAQSEARCYYDQTILSQNKNFSVYKEFSVDIYVRDAKEVSLFTLYFFSPNAPSSIFAKTLDLKTGWQTLKFPVNTFGVESGTPLWTDIDRVRISASRGSSAVASDVLIRGFRAVPRSSVAVIQDLSTNKYFQQTADILDSAYVKNDIMSPADIEKGYLNKDVTRIVILPQSTLLSSAAITRLQDFVNAGGRLIAFGAIDLWLQTLLGVSIGNPVPNSQASFQFSDSIITNLPTGVVKQNSIPFQISSIDTTTKHARVIARWNDQYPAWIASDTGFYMSSVLLKDTDYLNTTNATKQWKMLVAMINQYVPDVAKQPASDAIADSVYVGKYSDYISATTGIRANESQLSNTRVTEIETELERVDALQITYDQAYAAGNYINSIDIAKMRKVALRNAYNLSQLPGSTNEFRGVWSHDGFGPYPGNWTTSIKLLKDNGFNAVITNVSGAGFAHYNSNILPRSANTAVYGDQLVSVVQAAHAAGVKVHAWDLVWNLGGADMQGRWYQDLALKDNVTNQDRLMGQAVNNSNVWSLISMTIPAQNKSSEGWLSPCDQRNRDMKKAALLEMAKYEIDGIHLDYNRANGESTLFEDACRKRFEAYRGAAVVDWPAQVVRGGEFYATYSLWRPTVITSFTKEIHDALKPINDQKRRLGQPTIILSGAVFPDTDYGRLQNAQDWGQWITQGAIDALHPMNYTSDLTTFNNLISKQNVNIANRIPFYPGIGVVTDMPTDATIAQVVSTRGDNSSGIATGGFTMYNFGNVFAYDYTPVFGKSIGANQTAVAADLTLSATVGQPPVMGRSFTYTLAVTNRGPDSAMASVLNIWLPQGLTATSAVPSSGTCTLINPIECKFSLTATGQASVVLNLIAATANNFKIDASVVSNSTDQNSANNFVSKQVVVNSTLNMGLKSDYFAALFNGSGLSKEETAKDPSAVERYMEVTTRIPSSTTIKDVNFSQISAADGYRIQGFIYLTAGSTYKLTGSRDDSLLIKVGGNVVYTKGYNNWGDLYSGESDTGNPVVTPIIISPLKSGYYSLEVVVFNTDGRGNLDLNMSINNSASIDLKDANFLLYPNTSSVVNAGAVGAFVPNLDGGYYPFVSP